MASIREIARDYLDDAQCGIQWIAVWKTGRSWHGKNFCPADVTRNGFPTWEEEDLESLREIADADPHAVILNGYYHNLGDPDEMTAETLAKFLRWQYEDNNGYVISDYLPETAEKTVESEEVNETETTGKNTANMKYSMTVIIADPNTSKGMTSDIVLKMTCTFGYDPKQYGNGYAVYIEDGEGFGNYIDLRYDTSFDPDKKAEYLEKWARNYWNGEYGAYIVKSLNINILENKKYYLPTTDWNEFYGSADVVCIDEKERDRLAQEWNLDPVNDFREADENEIKLFGVYDS